VCDHAFQDRQLSESVNVFKLEANIAALSQGFEYVLSGAVTFK
jgi:hypothetical protein